jgi:hypothetical protein
MICKGRRLDEVAASKKARLHAGKIQRAARPQSQAGGRVSDGNELPEAPPPRRPSRGALRPRERKAPESSHPRRDGGGGGPRGVHRRHPHQVHGRKETSRPSDVYSMSSVSEDEELVDTFLSDEEDDIGSGMDDRRVSGQSPTSDMEGDDDGSEESMIID